MKTRDFLALMLLFILLVGCVASPATISPVTPTASTAPTVVTAIPSSTLTLTSLPSLTSTPTASATPTPSLSAQIFELQGGVKVKQPADADFLAAAVGMVLPNLSQVQTLEDGRTRVDLSSGSIIRIAPNSLFTLAIEDPNPENPLMRLKLIVGQLFIILRGGSVDVETPSGVASVLGSFMSVSIDTTTGDTAVQCLEGSCRIETPAGIYNLSTGQKARLRSILAGKTPLPPVLDSLTKNDLQIWLELNPEAVEVAPMVKATLESKPILTKVPRPQPTATKKRKEPPSILPTIQPTVIFSASY